METVKNIAAITALAATGAIVGHMVDMIADRVFASFELSSSAARAGLQAWAGVAILHNAASTIASAIRVDDPTGAISAMWYFFFSSQQLLIKDVQALASEVTSVVQGSLKPKHADEAKTYSHTGKAVNHDQ